MLRSSMNKQFDELLAEPSGEFDNFVRMSVNDFEYLLQKISPIIAKQDTDWRDAIPARIRLAVTYMSYRGQFQELASSF
ncbi:hypothetical protein HF086_011382 [Spodoptera exigua]|uniref:Uncharacterized protein n=1 Tax=Spodoptera exigua TaxID=7107 RepID=A0A922SQU9_SPOEX|nr:hypothetical protein HF086_011382 [Spodoptera exigua]